MLDSLKEYVSDDGHFRRRRKRQPRTKGIQKFSRESSAERHEDKLPRAPDEIRKSLRSGVDNNLHVKSSSDVLAKGNIDLNRFSIDRLLKDNDRAQNDDERFGHHMFAGLPRFQGMKEEITIV